MQKFISNEKFEKLVEKLQFLKNVRRPQVAEKIASAKDLGDLSENAEYSEAKDDQVFLEREIAELEYTIQTVVIAEKSKNQNVVSFGSVVEIKYNGQIKKYSIVGSAEADPFENKISNESPLGSALMGHAVGDLIEVKTPKGLAEYTILKIS